MNILVITGRYGSKAAANGICVKNIVDIMAKTHTVYCMCYDDYDKSPEELCRVIKNKRGILDSLLYKYENNRKLNLIINKIKKIKNIAFLPVWPWTDPIYTIKSYVKASKLCKKHKIDMVIGVHMPLSSLIISYLLKKKNSNIIYVAYFLDSLSGGMPLAIMGKKWNLKKKTKWENKLLKNADKIIVMESSKTHHNINNRNASFYKKLTFLDIPLLINIGNIKTQKTYFDKNKINVVFCGTANYPLRNIPYLMKIISNIKSEKITFHFFGNSNCNELINSKLGNIKYYSFVPHDSIPAILESADFLLNLGTKENSTISGKIFEYMSYNKPIISTYSIEEESCIPYLKKYKLAYLINENNNYKQETEGLIRFIYDNYGKNVESDKLYNEFYNNTPQAFVDEVLKGVKNE